MAKGNILKEAIADAKAVREVALQNAKAALEEAFTPKLQNMLNARLSEDLDEMDYDEDMEEGMYYDEDEKDMEEMMTYDEDESMDEEAFIDEEIDLEEILNELELEEGKKADDDDKEEVDEAVGYPNHRADQVQKVKHDATDINQGLNENEEFDLDSLLKEINDLEEEEVDERKNPLKRLKKDFDKVLDPTMGGPGLEEQPKIVHPAGRARRGMRGSSVVRRSPVAASTMMESAKEIENLKKELNETRKAFSKVKGELNEVNLLNSKLLYVNRIFKANNLDDAQKLRVVETLDKAESIKEAKLIYETIKDTFTVANAKKGSSKTKTRTLKEGIGMASKAAGTSTAPKKSIISETDNMVNRFQKLANIKINE